MLLADFSAWLWTLEFPFSFALTVVSDNAEGLRANVNCWVNFCTLFPEIPHWVSTFLLLLLKVTCETLSLSLLPAHSDLIHFGCLTLSCYPAAKLENVWGLALYLKLCCPHLVVQHFGSLTQTVMLSWVPPAYTLIIVLTLPAVCSLRCLTLMAWNFALCLSLCHL